MNAGMRESQWWPCPIDGGPLREATFGLGPGRKERFVHVDGSAHDEAGPYVRAFLSDGTPVSGWVRDVEHHSDGSTTYDLARDEP